MPANPNFRSALASTHLLSLCLWLAALLAAGASAALLFPSMKRLDPHLAEYASYTGEHWKIAAGAVANRLFLLADWIQLACALVTILTLGLAMHALPKGSPRPPLLGTRIVLVSLASALLCFQLFVLSPRMATNIKAFWDAARAGDNPKAATFQTAFDADHPTATRVLSGTAGTVLLALFAATWSLSSTPRERHQ